MPNDNRNQNSAVNVEADDVDDITRDNTQDDIIAIMIDELESYKPPTNPTRGAKANQPAVITTRHMDTLTRSLITLSKQIGLMRNENAKSNNIFRELTGKVHKLEQSNAVICGQVRHLENDNAQLRTEIRKLTERLDASEEKTDDLEQNTLSCSLTLRCEVPPPSEGATVTMADVKMFVKNKLKLADDDMGKFSIRKLGQTDNNYAIHVDSYNLKGLMFKKCKEEKPADFYIGEFLTKKRHKLMYDLRQLKSTDRRIERIFSFNGKVFIRKTGTAQPIPIKKVSDWEP